MEEVGRIQKEASAEARFTGVEVDTPRSKTIDLKSLLSPHLHFGRKLHFRFRSQVNVAGSDIRLKFLRMLLLTQRIR